ncbi:hypothetical protein JOD29_002556 [Lysinibacillus composti]|nr:hypothetical protein [Lysinibacillus composti]
MKKYTNLMKYFLFAAAAGLITTVPPVVQPDHWFIGF